MERRWYGFPCCVLTFFNNSHFVAHIFHNFECDWIVRCVQYEIVLIWWEPWANIILKKEWEKKILVISYTVQISDIRIDVMSLVPYPAPISSCIQNRKIEFSKNKFHIDGRDAHISGRRASAIYAIRSWQPIFIFHSSCFMLQVSDDNNNNNNIEGNRMKKKCIN